MKVLNFGSLNIDYIYQMAHFIRPGETAPCKTLTAGCGGKGLNQSIALAKAGTEVYHAGLYGAEAQFLLDKMQAYLNRWNVWRHFGFLWLFPYCSVP